MCNLNPEFATVDLRPMACVPGLMRFCLFLLLVLAGVPAKADPVTPPGWLQQQAAECQSAIARAETLYKLPHGLLGAIARTESGRPITAMNDVRAWPWTIDADGKGLFLDSKAAAIAWVRQAVTHGARFIDVGCMQVDLQLHPNAFASLDEAFDPERNTDYAARYLLSLRAEAKGDWNVAVGLYHSHTPELAAAYRELVAAEGRGIVTGIGGPEPLFMRAIRQGTLRLALAGGGNLVLHVRQPGKHPARMNGCQIETMLGPYLSPKVRNPCKAQRR